MFIKTSGMANYSLVEYTDESSDDEQLTPGIAVAMHTLFPPKKFFASSAHNHKIASSICMPIQYVSSNVTLNISATETSRNLSNSEPLVSSAAAISSKGAIEIVEAGPSTDVNESAPAIPPMINSEPLVWSAAATSSNATILVNDDVETPQTAPKKSRTLYRLSNEEAGVFVNEQVKLLLNFYTVDLNAKRNGPPSSQTKDKLVERLCFLFFCKRIIFSSF